MSIHGEDTPLPEIMQIHGNTGTAERPRDPNTNLYIDPDGPIGTPYAFRSPADNLGDGISLETGISFDPEDKIVRAELAEQTDIQWIMQHYAGGVWNRQARYDDIDYSIDLQTAMAADEYLKQHDLTAPEELKEKYPDKYAILRGIESGEYEKDLKELEKTQAAARMADELKAKNPPNDPPTKTQPAKRETVPEMGQE